MGQISYIGKFDSAEHLDKIMYSYPGWRRGTVMDDQRKQFERTAIGVVRINALRQMREVGTPNYDDYISYRDGQINIHCGNIEPTTILTNLARHPELREFCIFAHPGRAQNGTAKYYRFDFSKEAHETAGRYQSEIYDYIRRKSEKYSWIFPSLPADENDPTE